MAPSPLTQENLEALEALPSPISPQSHSHSTSSATVVKPTLPKLSLDATTTKPPAPSSLPSPVSASASAEKATTAAKAVQAIEHQGVLYSPTVTSIVKAFQEEGDGDKELLKAVLWAKAKEDERLAARDILKAEQLRAATLLAQSQHQYYLAAQYAAMSPTTPDSASSLPPWERLHPLPHPPPYSQPSVFRNPNNPTQMTGLRSPTSPHPIMRPSSQRSISSSSLSPPSHYIEPYDDIKRKRSHSHSNSEEAPAIKKVKITPHEQAMQALRARCQRNKADLGKSTSSAAQEKEKKEIANKPRKKRFIATPLSTSPPPPAAATVAVQVQVLAPSPTPTLLENAEKKGSPPLRTQSPEPTSTSTSIPTPPPRSSLLLSTLPSRSIPAVSSIRSTSLSPPLASAARFNKPPTPSNNDGNGTKGKGNSPPPSSSNLRMLLNAGNYASGNGYRAETSDVRSEVVEVAK